MLMSRVPLQKYAGKDICREPSASNALHIIWDETPLTAT